MKILDRPEPSQKFLEDRRYAMLYIQKKMNKFDTPIDDEMQEFRWIKTELSYPSFDDFTFAYRNKIFSVLVERAKETENNKFSFGNERRVKTLTHECKNNNLTPCIFPIIENNEGGYIFYGEWNLINAITKKFVAPITEASDELIEVSDWELQNWAVQIVADNIYNQGLKLFSYCDVLGIEPNIWFENAEGKTCWVEVLFTKYPNKDKPFSFKNWPSEVLKHDGYKAIVSFANAENFSEKIYRAQAADVNFKGIEYIYSPNL